MILLALGSSCSQRSDLRTNLCLITQHHDKVIPDITIYVKFNTDDFPGYDPPEQFDRVIVSDAQGKVCLSDFPLGHHWFVGIGYDEEIREQVIGNIDLYFDLRNLSAEAILYVGEE
ncbi:MAG: hypothetical protein HKN76_06845 [Saprospiraceae bacterium]|nr:hypothetical protein [Saprospiraceae bacterium]